MSLFGDPIKEAISHFEEYDTRKERVAYFIGYLFIWTILRPLPIAVIILWVWWFYGS